MKKIWYFLLLSLCLIGLPGEVVDASSFGISSSVKQISPNGTFTVQVGGDSIGRVDLSVTNGTLSQNTVWIEQGYVTVKVTASSSGNVVVTARPAVGFSDADGNLYHPGAKSVSVLIASSKPSTGSSKPSTGTSGSNSSKPSKDKSSNCDLASLSVDSLELSPNFDASKTAYSLSLKADVTSLTVKAVAKDKNAKVEGAGEVSLNLGKNVISIVVTAEDGTKKTYTIDAYVDDTPQVYLDYSGEKIGVLRVFDGITIPEGFTTSHHTIDSYDISTFDAENLVMIAGVSSDDKRDFFWFSKSDNKILGRLLPVSFGERVLLVLDSSLPYEGKRKEIVTINDQEVSGYSFDEDSHYYLLKTVSLDGKVVDYLYESSENTVQLYPSFLSVCKSDKSHFVILTYVLGGVLLVIVSSLVVFYTKKKRGNIHEKK